MTGVVVVDVETTGLSSETDRVVEIAAVRLNWNGESYDADGVRHCLVDPERSIPCTASAVHHLTDADVVDARKLSEAIGTLNLRPSDVIVAHNADFDRSFLSDLQNHIWICTWRVAQRLIPDAPAFSNQVLRYHLGIDVEAGHGRSGMPHSAGFDARTTAGIMRHLLTLASIEDMIQITKEPVLLSRMTFGKYRGLPFAEIPADYRRWLRGLPDLDPNLRYTLEQNA